jgi:isopentenyldiphosphate isomerase
MAMGDFEITVNKNDHPTGFKHWREMGYEDIYRVSALWLYDTATGETLIVQRSFGKKNDPGKWGTAVAGTVERGETYRGNIIKEIEEEIGLKGLTLITCPKVFIDDGVKRYFCQLFKAGVDKNQITIRLDRSEAERYKWVSVEWLIKDVKQSPNNYTPFLSQQFALIKDLF